MLYHNFLLYRMISLLAYFKFKLFLFLKQKEDYTIDCESTFITGAHQLSKSLLPICLPSAKD